MLIDPHFGLNDPTMDFTYRLIPETIFVGHGPGWWAEISADVTPADKNGYPKVK